MSTTVKKIFVLMITAGIIASGAFLEKLFTCRDGACQVHDQAHSGSVSPVPSFPDMNRTTVE